MPNMKKDQRYQTVKDILRLSQEDAFQDVIIRCYDGTLRQNQLLLSFLFPLFKEIINDMRFDEEINVTIPDHSVDDFKDFFESVFFQKLEIKSGLLFLVDQALLSEETFSGFITYDDDFDSCYEELLKSEEKPAHAQLTKLEEEEAEEKPVQISFRKKLNHYNVKSLFQEQKVKSNKTKNKAQKIRQHCTYCGKISSDINKHVKYECQKRDFGYGELKCDFCKKTFNKPSNLKKHIQQTHKRKDEKVICNICGVMTGSKYSLKKHLESVHAIRELKFTCQECGKMWPTKGSLTKHMLSHTLVKTPCPICGTRLKDVETHMKTAHEKDEDKRFQCQDCGKGFQDRSDLKGHQMNVHLKLRPYACRYGCDISYNDNSNRNSHERKTHGKIFTTVNEEKLKEKIKFLGIDTNQITTPFI